MTDWIGRRWAQRWLDGTQTWATAPGPVFDPDRYTVAHVTEAAARDFVTRHHYLSTWVASTRCRYGMFDHSTTPARLVGVAVMAIPPNKAVLTNVFPTLTPYKESLVLSRLVLLDQVPWSAESHMMGQVCGLAVNDGLYGLVMDSDPVPRYRPDGNGGWEQYMPGHVGSLYQSCGFQHLGPTSPQSQWLLKDGTILSRRALQKVRASESGHRYVEALLVKHGADPMQEGEDPRLWLSGAKLASGARSVQHPGFLRYAVGLTSAQPRLGLRARRNPGLIAPRAYPYPKKHAGQLALFDPR